MRAVSHALFASVLASACALTLLPGAAFAQKKTEGVTAEQILDKALAKSQVGFQQGTATLEMKIVSPRGEAKSRTLQVKAMRGEGGLLRSLVRFQKPAEVAGIAFLVREKKGTLPDQYVYVPAAKVVRQIAAGNASSSFFGSDFTYADLMPLPASERDKVKLTRLADSDVGGQPVYVVEAMPQFEGSPYSKLVTYVHTDHLVPLKVEFYDPQGKALKVLSVKKLMKVKDELVPVELVMTNVQQNSRTEISIVNPDPDAKLSEADFTEEAMQR